MRELTLSDIINAEIKKTRERLRHYQTSDTHMISRQAYRNGAADKPRTSDCGKRWGRL